MHTTEAEEQIPLHGHVSIDIIGHGNRQLQANSERSVTLRLQCCQRLSFVHAGALDVAQALYRAAYRFRESESWSLQEHLIRRACAWALAPRPLLQAKRDAIERRHRRCIEAPAVEA